MKKTMEFYFKHFIVLFFVSTLGAIGLLTSCHIPNTIVGKTFVQQEPHKNGKYSVMTFTKTGSVEANDIYSNGKIEKSSFDYIVVDNDLKISGFGGLVSRNIKITWINTNKMEVLLDDGKIETYAVKGSSDDEVTHSVVGKTFVLTTFGAGEYRTYSFNKKGGLIINSTTGDKNEDSSTSYSYVENLNEITLTNENGVIDKVGLVWLGKNWVNFHFESGIIYTFVIQGSPDDKIKPIP